MELYRRTLNKLKLDCRTSELRNISTRGMADSVEECQNLQEDVEGQQVSDINSYLEGVKVQTSGGYHKGNNSYDSSGNRYLEEGGAGIYPERRRGHREAGVVDGDILLQTVQGRSLNVTGDTGGEPGIEVEIETNDGEDLELERDPAYSM